jgi:myo-inositol-1(or 4)-monophosphatase
MSDLFRDCLELALDAADDAGNLIRENWQKPQKIDYKGAIDLVTSVDRESERRIVGRLRREFPSHSFLAEEETSIAAESDYRWIIDPLDGTTNFAHGYPQFCISIALEFRGEIQMGTVYNPIAREAFSAIKGGGASLNGQSIAVSAVPELNTALLGTGFPYDRRENPDFYLAYFKAFMTRCQGIRRTGSAALDLCSVACGRLDGFWELKLKPWDIAAGSLIVTEAGGRLSNFNGAPFSIWGNETMASNGLIHEEMSRIASEISQNYVD